VVIADAGPSTGQPERDGSGAGQRSDHGDDDRDWPTRAPAGSPDRSATATATASAPRR
jgi:hypothetical protein